MTRYTLHVPVEYTTRDGGTKTTYRRVGAVFENARRDTGETILSRSSSTSPWAPPSSWPSRRGPATRRRSPTSAPSDPTQGSRGRPPGRPPSPPAGGDRRAPGAAETDNERGEARCRAWCTSCAVWLIVCDVRSICTPSLIATGRARDATARRLGSTCRPRSRRRRGDRPSTRAASLCEANASPSNVTGLAPLRASNARIATLAPIPWAFMRDRTVLGGSPAARARAATLVRTARAAELDRFAAWAGGSRPATLLGVAGAVVGPRGKCRSVGHAGEWSLSIHPGRGRPSTLAGRRAAVISRKRHQPDRDRLRGGSAADAPSSPRGGLGLILGPRVIPRPAPPVVTPSPADLPQPASSEAALPRPARSLTASASPRGRPSAIPGGAAACGIVVEDGVPEAEVGRERPGPRRLEEPLHGSRGLRIETSSMPRFVGPVPRARACARQWRWTGVSVHRSSRAAPARGPRVGRCR